MKKFLLSISFLALLAVPMLAEEIIVREHCPNHGLDQIYVEPPVVTYDDNLNELHVYFGSTSSITIEYVDPSGTPYYFVYGENHAGYTSAT